MTEHEQAPASRSRRGSTTVESADAAEASCTLLASAVDAEQCRTDLRSNNDSRSRLKVPARSSSAAPHAEAAHRKEGPTWHQPSGCGNSARTTPSARDAT